MHGQVVHFIMEQYLDILLYNTFLTKSSPVSCLAMTFYASRNTNLAVTVIHTWA